MTDDHLMAITHVIRGSEWLPSMPLHMHVIRAFGWDEPLFVHLSVFLKPSGKGKLSKRDSAQAIKDGYSIFVGDMKDLGYIPEGVLNWMVLMGWGVPEDDVMTLDEMIARFDIEKLTPSPAAINFAKLDHFNATHIRKLQSEDLAARIKPYFLREGLSVDDAQLLKVIPLIRERMVTLDDCLPFAAWFFKPTIEPNPADLIGKNLSAAQSAEVARNCLIIYPGSRSWIPPLPSRRCGPWWKTWDFIRTRFSASCARQSRVKRSARLYLKAWRSLARRRSWKE